MVCGSKHQVQKSPKPRPKFRKTLKIITSFGSHSDKIERIIGDAAQLMLLPTLGGLFAQKRRLRYLFYIVMNSNTIKDRHTARAAKLEHRS